MAKSFSNIKSPFLDILDTITFGKYNGCRVCDVLAEDLEYFDWLKKNGKIFTQDLEDNIQQLKDNIAYETYQREEVDPWVKPMTPFFDDWDDDIPF